jgi:hypothetical protein
MLLIYHLQNSPSARCVSAANHLCKDEEIFWKHVTSFKEILGCSAPVRHVYCCYVVCCVVFLMFSFFVVFLCCLYNWPYAVKLAR